MFSMKTGDKIPRGETLIFEVELIGAYPHYQSGMPNMWERMNTNKNDFVEYQEVCMISRYDLVRYAVVGGALKFETL